MCIILSCPMRRDLSSVWFEINYLPTHGDGLLLKHKTLKYPLVGHANNNDFMVIFIGYNIIIIIIRWYKICDRALNGLHYCLCTGGVCLYVRKPLKYAGGLIVIKYFLMFYYNNELNYRLDRKTRRHSFNDSPTVLLSSIDIIILSKLYFH